MDWQAAWLTLKLAAATTAILVVVGLPLAWWLATTTARWRFLVDATVALPLVLPPTVLGFYLLVVLGPGGAVGGPLSAIGVRLPFTFGGLLIGSVLFNLPFAVRPFAAAFAAVDRRYLEAAWTLGLSPLATFRRVALPLAAPGIGAGVVLTLAHAVGEFGVVMMIGGNIPGATRTLSIAIYDDVQALDYARAHTTALALLLFSFLALAVAYRAQKRTMVV